MKPDNNDAYIAETWNDQLLDRTEDAKEQECPECEGLGIEYFSDCCGTEIIDGKCTDCKQDCVVSSEPCEVCKGEGSL